MPLLPGEQERGGYTHNSYHFMISDNQSLVPEVHSCCVLVISLVLGVQLPGAGLGSSERCR